MGKATRTSDFVCVDARNVLSLSKAENKDKKRCIPPRTNGNRVFVSITGWTVTFRCESHSHLMDFSLHAIDIDAHYAARRQKVRGYRSLYRYISTCMEAYVMYTSNSTSHMLYLKLQ